MSTPKKTSGSGKGATYTRPAQEQEPAAERTVYGVPVSVWNKMSKAERRRAQKLFAQESRRADQQAMVDARLAAGSTTGQVIQKSVSALASAPAETLSNVAEVLSTPAGAAAANAALMAAGVPPIFPSTGGTPANAAGALATLAVAEEAVDQIPEEKSGGSVALLAVPAALLVASFAGGRRG